MQQMIFSETDRFAVVDAYRVAAAARKHTADCYIAAIDALQRMHPALSRQDAAAEAVRIITSNVKFAEMMRLRR